MSDSNRKLVSMIGLSYFGPCNSINNLEKYVNKHIIKPFTYLWLQAEPSGSSGRWWDCVYSCYCHRVPYCGTSGLDDHPASEVKPAARPVIEHASGSAFVSLSARWGGHHGSACTDAGQNSATKEKINNIHNKDDGDDVNINKLRSSL